MINFQTNVAPGTHAEAIFRLIQTMAASGWQVISRSPGYTSGLNNTPVANPYPFSSGNIGFTGSQDISNNGAWIVMQQPPIGGRADGGGIAAPWGGTRQLAIQRSTAGTNVAWRVKYSFSGAYTVPASVGTATVMPSQNAGIADEVLLLGGGTDAAPTFTTWFGLGTEGTSKMNIFVDNGSMTGSLSGSNTFAGMIPNPWPYGIWMWMWQAGAASSPHMGFIVDPMVTGSFPGLETDPFTFYVDGLNAGCYNTNYQGGSSTYGPKTWIKKGGVNTVFTITPGATYYNASGVISPTGISANAITNLEDMLPIPYLRSLSAAGFGGYKGLASIGRWIGSSKAQGSTFSVFLNRDRIVVGTLVVPWDGSAPSL